VKTLTGDVVRDRSATPVNFWSRRPWLFVEQKRNRRNEDEAEDEMPTHDPPGDQIVHGLTSSLREQVDRDSEPPGFGGTTRSSRSKECSYRRTRSAPKNRGFALVLLAALRGKHTLCAFARNPMAPSVGLLPSPVRQ
jgi:hypothetical protein